MEISWNFVSPEKWEPCSHSVHRSGYLWSHVLSRGWYVQGGWILTHPPDTWTWDTTGCGWQVGGMHPTGMLSCSEYVLTLVRDE